MVYLINGIISTFIEYIVGGGINSISSIFINDNDVLIMQQLYIISMYVYILCIIFLCISFNAA